MIDFSDTKGTMVDLNDLLDPRNLECWTMVIDMRPSARLRELARRVVEAGPSDEPIEKWAARLAEDISEFTD